MGTSLFAWKECRIGIPAERRMPSEPTLPAPELSHVCARHAVPPPGVAQVFISTCARTKAMSVTSVRLENRAKHIEAKRASGDWPSADGSGPLFPPKTVNPHDPTQAKPLQVLVWLRLVLPNPNPYPNPNPNRCSSG